MGLFSFFSKNKQDRAAEDSGRFYSKDDDAALGERARSKRASHGAGAEPGARTGRRQAADPMLPEKKRARRRLVGAIALALAAAVGLPMLMDSEPNKSLAGDIAIQVPSKDKAAPLPIPAAPAPTGEKPVAAKDSVDKGEEVVSAPSAPKPGAVRPPVTAVAIPAAPPAAPAVARAERKPELPRPEHKLEHKPDARLADKADKAEKLDKLPKPKNEDKPVKPHEDAARALAILEGRAARADKPEKDKPAESASQKFVLQVAAMSSMDKAAEVQARLREAGISSHTEKSGAPGGLIRVKVGPLSKDEADKVRAKLGRLGYSGFMTPV